MCKIFKLHLCVRSLGIRLLFCCADVFVFMHKVGLWKCYKTKYFLFPSNMQLKGFVL